MEAQPDKTATATIELLEHRLRRIEYILSGDEEASNVLQQAAAQGKECNINARISKLEDALSNLSSKSRVIQDLLRLCEDHPIGSLEAVVTNSMDRRSLSRPVPANCRKGCSDFAHGSRDTCGY